MLPIAFENNNGNGRLNLFNGEYQYDFNVNQQSGSSIQLDFTASVPASIFAAAGLYVLGLEIDLVDAASGEPVASTQLFDFQVLVEPKLQTNLAGTRSAGVDGVKLSVIDFGELKTGMSERIFIQIRGNAPAKITVSSENKGRLLMEKTTHDFIDYSVSVDGESSTLEAPLNLRRPVTQDLRGTSYPMDVKIGNVEGAFAGVYRDVISIEVQPQ